MKRTYTLVVCIAICAGYFFFGLWPFRLHVKNNIIWQPGDDGTFFAWLSNVYSEGELDLGRSPPPARQAGAISIELYLQSEHRPTGNVGSILSLYDGEFPPNLVIAQWKYELLLRTPARIALGRRTYREASVSADLRPGVRRFIVITSGAGGTSFYVDGRLAKTYPRLILRPEILRGRLVVGDAPEGSSHWSGKLMGVAVFNRSLSALEVSRHHRYWRGKRLQEFTAEPGLSALYDFAERSGRTIPDRSVAGNPLLIPESYRTFRKTVLVPPWSDPHPYFSDAEDVAVNILGFVPFGFFYLIYRDQVRPRRALRNIGVTSVVSGIISIAIELMQVYLPIRSSSLTDVVCNIAGGLAGALLAAVVMSFARMRTARRTWSY